MLKFFFYAKVISINRQEAHHSADIAHVDGHYATQSHSRSHIYVPIESPNATYE